MTQQTTSSGASPNYPAPGSTYRFDFGADAFRNSYSPDRKSMTFTRQSNGFTGTVQYTAMELRPNLFWNYWIDADGSSVSRIEDFERGVAHAMIHFHDGRVLNVSGTFKKLE